MCNETTFVAVGVPADLSSTGRAERKKVQIDACIADLIRALQAADIDTRGCCCGHGKRCGDIALEDGRVLLVISAENAKDWFCRDGITWLTAEIGRRAREMQNRLARWAEHATRLEGELERSAKKRAEK